MKRRTFLGAVAATVAAAAGAEASEDAIRGDMRYRKLGRTGEEVSFLGLGGHHIGRQKDEKDSIAIIRAAIDAGVTFMDNCWDYHDGGSELRMGKALQDGYRKKVFLMTKIDGRTEEVRRRADRRVAEAAADRRDRPAAVPRDHPPGRPRPHLRRAAAPWRRSLAAKKAGKIRYIGFTGHKDPLVHLRMLEVAAEHGFRFDAVQMPLNVMDAHFRSFEKQVLPVLVREEVGVLGMKSLGGWGDPQEQDGHPDRVPALRHEPADLVRHQRDRQHEDSQAEPGSGEDVPAAERQGTGRSPGANGEGGSGRSLRALQDDQRIRRHGKEPEMARRGGQGAVNSQ